MTARPSWHVAATSPLSSMLWHEQQPHIVNMCSIMSVVVPSLERALEHAATDLSTARQLKQPASTLGRGYPSSCTTSYLTHTIFS